MPIRLPFRSIRLSPGSLLSGYWGTTGYFRPEIDLYLVGPTGVCVPWVGQIDSSSDWVVFEEGVALQLGLSPPFSQVVSVSGIAGAVQAQFTLPPDGTVSLFITDYREWYFLPAPPVGFWPAAPGGGQRRNVLGATGFLQHFEVRLHYQLSRPEVELIDHPGFPGEFGTFPRGAVLRDFIRSRKFPP
jgi:hypothetical protein